MPPPLTVPAIVLGTGVTALGVLRCLARHGIPSAVVMDFPELVHRSRWFRQAPPPLLGTLPATLAEAISSSPYERAVLIPCSDRWLAAVAALPEGVRQRFPACVPPPKTVRAVTDKAEFAGALREAGVAHPQTEQRVTKAVLDGLPNGFFERAFLKPHDSQAFLAHHGVKAVWVHSAREALERATELEGRGFSMALQEYVPGPPSNHVFVDGFADRAGTLRCVFARRRLRMHPSDFGNSTYQVSIAPDKCQPAIDAVQRLTTSLQYFGVLSVEFKRDQRDGGYRMIELNARPWWYVEFAAWCGVDVVRVAYRDALGLPPEPIAPYRVGRRCIYPYYDYFACRATWGSRFTGLARCAAASIGAIQPIWRLSDPLPAVSSLSASLLGHLRRIANRGRP